MPPRPDIQMRTGRRPTRLPMKYGPPRPPQARRRTRRSIRTGADPGKTPQLPRTKKRRQAQEAARAGRWQFPWGSSRPFPRRRSATPMHYFHVACLRTMHGLRQNPGRSISAASRCAEAYAIARNREPARSPRISHRAPRRFSSASPQVRVPSPARPLRSHSR